MKIINLTPHTVCIRDTQYKPSGTTARVNERFDYTERDGLLFKDIKQQRLVGMPRRENGTFYIVSRVVVEHTRSHTNRTITDLLFPDDLIFENGKVVGCKSLGRLRR